jgi:uracil phosphoribosyltransferase
MKSNVTVISHPLAFHSLTILRDKNTTTHEFRFHAKVVSSIILMEATKHLQTIQKKIQTPLAPIDGITLSENLAVVPVLRAGLAMLSAMEDLLPSVPVGFVGLERNEKTAIAREYYRKLPNILKTHQVFILDPMLATGGSFDDTVNIVKSTGTKDISLLCIVAAPEGIKRIEDKHPDVKIITTAIDSHLNDKKYIVPGLGDFGDRYFGTV